MGKLSEKMSEGDNSFKINCLRGVKLWKKAVKGGKIGRKTVRGVKLDETVWGG